MVAAWQAGAQTNHTVHARQDHACLALQRAHVRHLPTGLDVEGRPIEGDVAGSADRKLDDLALLVVEHGKDPYAVDVGGRIALKVIARSSQALLDLRRCERELIALAIERA